MNTLEPQQNNNVILYKNPARACGVFALDFIFSTLPWKTESPRLLCRSRWLQGWFAAP